MNNASKPPLKIIHIVPTYYPALGWGGPIHSVMGINESISDLGIDLTVLTTDAASPNFLDNLSEAEKAYSFKYKVHYYRRIFGVSISFGLLFGMIRWIRCADVVHISAVYNFPIIPAIALCRLLDKPIVWCTHGAILQLANYSETKKKILKKIWNFSCLMLLNKKKTILHGTSAAECDVLHKFFPGIPVRLIPHGICENKVNLNTRVWRPNESLRIMYLGRISPEKGIENVLFALAKLDKFEVEFKIYGDGPSLIALKRLAGELKFPRCKVSFMGFADQMQKEEAFNCSDVCIVPSYSENFCMVVLEALSHGVPVICSKGAPWESINAEGCGLWVGNSPDELLHAIHQMYHLPLDDMGRRGINFARKYYGWDRVGNLIKTLYVELSLLD
jgi:glycosyltransferase involved in cell wall biosynthesis